MKLSELLKVWDPTAGYDVSICDMAGETLFTLQANRIGMAELLKDEVLSREVLWVTRGLVVPIEIRINMIQDDAGEAPEDVIIEAEEE